MTLSRLARESGISKARLSLWLNGKYIGNNEAVCADLVRWLKSRQAGEGVSVGVTDWQPTPTGNRILRVLLYAQNGPDMALIYGGAGVGKTFAARRYQEENSNVWLATMTPAVKSVPACLGRVAAALGLSDCPRSAIALENAIIRRLEGTKGLLIVDEAQFLSSESLEAVRSLYDASGSGIAFMGNEIIYTRVTGGVRQAQFAQLFSRIGFRLRLAEPEQGDVEAILARHGVQDVKMLKLCHGIAKESGALRGLCKALRLAALMVAEDGADLSPEHVQAAWAELGGK